MTEVLEGEAVPQRLDIELCRSLDQSIQMRVDTDRSPLGTLVGEFSLFSQWYEINSYWEGNFLEQIAPGAFKRTINNRSGQSPVRVLLEHGFDPTVADKPLGVPDVLEESATGAYAETPLLDTSYNRDLAPALKAGAYGQSFRFQVMRDEWVEEPGVSDHNPGGIPERTIKELRLVEFGPTIFPASPGTNSTTGVRSTTDEFYEQLARRDTSRYDAAVRSVRSVRAPVSADRSAESTTEDPPTGHSEDPVQTDAPEAAQPTDDAPVVDHSEDPPQVTHSEDPQNDDTSTDERTSIMETETMTVEERAARQSEIRARLAEIDTEYAGNALPQDTQTEWDNLQHEFVEHRTAIEATEARREALAVIADNPDAAVSVGETVQRTADAARGRGPNVTRRPENIYDLTAIRQEARSIDELPALYRDRAMRAVEQARFPGAEDRAAAQEHVARLLDRVDDTQATIARRILVTGSPTYDRAFGKAVSAMSTNGLTAEENRALSLGADAGGGFAVPFQLDPTVILTGNGVIDTLRAISRVEQITGKEWQGVTSAGVTVSRKAEAAESDDNSPTLAQPVVRTTRVDGFVPFSVEIEQDWAQMRTEITNMLADAKMDEEADSFINGDGSANSGSGLEPEGLLTGATTVVETASTSLTRADLFKLKSALGPRFRARGTFLAEGSFYDAVRGLDEDGDVWSSLANDAGDRLLGRPAIEGSEMPVFSTDEDSQLAVFGDFSKFLIVDRVGMNVELVPHLFHTDHNRPSGQRGIWAWWRNGSKVLVPNAFRVLQIVGS